MDIDWRRDRIGSAIRGENPTVLRRLTAGFAVVGDVQFLPGYCLLLSTDPTATALADLPRGERVQFLADLDLLATAVQDACAAADPAFRRVNIDILGNTDAFVHAHVFPRYDWEPPALRPGPVWRYDPGAWHDPATALGPAHDALRAAITARLEQAVAADDVTVGVRAGGAADDAPGERPGRSTKEAP